MTSSVTFDTSGVVEFASNDGVQVHIRGVMWPDLSPFCQGYVEAAFAAFGGYEWKDEFGGAWPAKFSDLHPATLARFMEDCEAVQRIFAGMDLTAEDGRRCWQHRVEGFPGPLATDRLLRAALRQVRLSLSPDGKVLAEDVNSSNGR